MSGKLAGDLRAAGELVVTGATTATGDAGQTALAAARPLVPRLTGRLASSLVVRLSGPVATLASNAPYAGPIHWGWRRRNIRPSLFLTRGAQSSEGKWIESYVDAIDKALDTIDREYTQNV